MLLKLEATLPEAGFEVSWVGVGVFVGPHLQQGWSRPRAQRGSSGSRRGTQSCPTYGATPLNVPSRSVRKCGGADESAALVLPRVLSVPTTGSEMAICKVSFIWGAPNFPPCAQGERENQAEFRKSILTAAPPPALLPSGVPGLLMGATRGIPQTILWRLRRVHDIPSLYFPVYSEHV